MRTQNEITEAVGRGIFFWVLRFFVGALITLGGLYLLGVDLSALPWWKSIGGLMLTSIGFAVMPNLPGK